MLSMSLGKWFMSNESVGFLVRIPNYSGVIPIEMWSEIEERIRWSIQMDIYFSIQIQMN